MEFVFVLSLMIKNFQIRIKMPEAAIKTNFKEDSALMLGFLLQLYPQRNMHLQNLLSIAYVFNNGNIRTMCEIFSRTKIKTPVNNIALLSFY